RRVCHLRLDDKKAADEAARRMNVTPPRTAHDFSLAAGDYLHRLQDVDKAAAQYRRALHDSPRHIDAPFRLVLRALHQQDEPARLARLTACLTLRPRSPIMHYLRGMAYFQQKEYELALLDFSSSVGCDAKFKLGYFYRGRMLVVQRKWD